MIDIGVLLAIVAAELGLVVLLLLILVGAEVWNVCHFRKTQSERNPLAELGIQNIRMLPLNQATETPAENGEEPKHKGGQYL